MTHPSPWQLELHALGEDVPEVREHLPCPQCEGHLHLVTRDPGPVPLLILSSLRASRTPEVVPTRATWTTALVGGGVLAVGALLVAVWWVSPPGGSSEGPPLLPARDGARAPEPSSVRRRSPEPDPPTDLPPEPPDRRIHAWTRVEHGTEGHAQNPVWSPDGLSLAFEVNDYGARSALFVRTPDGAVSGVRLPGAGGPFGDASVAVNPVWRDDRLLVFEGSNAGGVFRLYLHRHGPDAVSELIAASEITGDLTFPSFDPRRPDDLVFVADATGKGDVWRRTATGVLNRVVESPDPERFPTIDPSGAQLAFTRESDGHEDLWTLPLDEAGDAVLRAGGPGDQTRPTWADGTLVYFSGSAGARWDLKALDPDGEPRTLAEGVRLPMRARPALSPDRRWVAWTLEDPAKASSIWIGSVDGSQRVEVPTPRIAVGEPALAAREGGVRVAYTGLESSGSDWRELFVVDVDLP